MLGLSSAALGPGHRWRVRLGNLPPIGGVLMNTDVLLYQLRQRLAWVQKCIATHERTSSENTADTNRYLLASGALTELRSEQLFLAGLIDQLEEVAA